MENMTITVDQFNLSNLGNYVEGHPCQVINFKKAVKIGQI